ncbi:MAG: hypothetical protein KBS98_06095 [Flavobacterium sp.]|nr:hypothetical protein [Candidatus Neoflavobacterium equi]
MKKIVLSLALVAVGGIYTTQAQNKNVEEVVKERVITVKDNEGEKKIIKRENVSKSQDIEFRDAESNKLNKEQAVTPIRVNKSIEVSVDGVKRMVDVDRSATYDLYGEKFYVVLDKVGYTVRNAKGKTIAYLRENGNGTYVFGEKNKSSTAFFDANGNMIVETFDYRDDTFTKYMYKKM